MEASLPLDHRYIVHGGETEKVHTPDERGRGGGGWRGGKGEVDWLFCVGLMHRSTHKYEEEESRINRQRLSRGRAGKKKWRAAINRPCALLCLAG